MKALVGAFAPLLGAIARIVIMPALWVIGFCTLTVWACLAVLVLPGILGNDILDSALNKITRKEK